jgi:hypothetical protein
MYRLSMIWILLMPLCAATSATPSSKEPTPPPNIVVFMIQGLFFESEDITPSLNHLAEEGVVLDSYYTCPDDSVPSRASFLYGVRKRRFVILYYFYFKFKFLHWSNFKILPNSLGSIFHM